MWSPGPLILTAVLASANAQGAPPAGALAAPNNAWDAWTRPLPTVDEKALWPIESLAPQRTIDRRELRALELDGLALEEALTQAQRGLEVRPCRVEGHGQILRPMKLGRRVTGVAVLRSSRGGDAAEAVETVLLLGRAVARCDGSLLTFEIGRSIEEQGRALAIWLAAKPDGDRGALERVRGVLAAQQLQRADLARAIEREGRFSASMLPDDDVAAGYSRASTTALLLNRTREVAHAVRTGRTDLGALRARFDALVRTDERALGAALSELPHVELPDRVAKLTRDAPAREPNLAGRLIIRALGASLVKVAERAAGQLDEARGALGDFESARTAPRAPDDDDSATTMGDLDAPMARSPGRCRQLGDGVFVLDDVATAQLRAGWGPMLANEAMLSPEIVADSAIGLRVFGFSSDSLAASCGFAESDVLLTVNGVDLDSPSNALEAPHRVDEDGEARFTVQRGALRLQIIVRPGR